jgi:hypothetical protein
MIDAGLAQGVSPVVLSSATLPELLARARVVRAEDTGISGWIRLLELDGEILTQEETPDHRVLVRRHADVVDAERFVEERLATYDRMWDGCGCKVDYDQP